MSTKQKIFACALELFSISGFNGVSMRDLAERVGIKGSSIYNHYSGKKAIMDDICETFARTLDVSRPPLVQIERMLDQMNAVELFQSLIRAYGKKINKTWTQMARIIFSEHFYNEKAAEIFKKELIRENVAYYVSVLTLMERKGKIKGCEKELIATLFNNEQLMLSMQYAHCTTAEEHAELAAMMMASADYLFRGLEIRN
ncbi:TetR/AcrR family transcriptional regulator [Sporolactobacillus shoreicorticis]|uniref:TetR/AcrR family transcriptional regulator n=1 Tax=Sporolactobacillus shoreicorticis TaxID=1923877 RepID=A0ABW5S522_9BACL|nr:TetR/AcrR family transcriptional regulator [Sporolactobacillus shoreicorticis]MCO7126695.1 TetR/AcrR family transcriptional regulator [Sporolactobacillus shoreicorticis]